MQVGIPHTADKSIFSRIDQAVKLQEMYQRMHLLETQISELQAELATTKEELHQMKCSLREAKSHQQVDAPISPEREQLFHSIVQAKIHQSKTAIIAAKGQCGRPIHLTKVTMAEMSSAEVSQTS